MIREYILKNNEILISPSLVTMQGIQVSILFFPHLANINSGPTDNNSRIMYFTASSQVAKSKRVLYDTKKIQVTLSLQFPVHKQSNPFTSLNIDVMNALRKCQLPEAKEKHSK